MLFPTDYLNKYTGTKMTLLLNEFKKLKQKELLSFQNKAVKNRQENVEDVFIEEAYLANNAQKQVVDQQDDDIFIKGLMEALPEVEKDLNLS
jgi:hypothetical protein